MTGRLSQAECTPAASAQAECTPAACVLRPSELVVASRPPVMQTQSHPTAIVSLLCTLAGNPCADAFRAGIGNSHIHGSDKVY